VISLDTNIFVYAVDPQAGRNRDIGRRLINEAAALKAVLAVQVIGEFLAVMRRRATKTNDAFNDARWVADWMRSTFEIVALEKDAFASGARSVTDHNFPVWDAMLWATLDRAGCRTLLTEEFQDGRTLGGVTFLNPFNPANEAAIARAMRRR
jgi:predicted nucleic acid-binding protein